LTVIAPRIQRRLQHLTVIAPRIQRRLQHLTVIAVIEHKVRVLFGSTSVTVRFGFGLSNTLGSFGLVCMAKDMGSSSVRVLFDSHL